MLDEKHVFRYLNGTVDYGLKYDANQKIKLHGYVDSDQEGCGNDRNSTSRCSFSLGSGMISMFSRKQSCLVLSTVKVEYVASCLASYEVVCLRNLLSDLFDLQLEVNCIFCINQSCGKFSVNPMFHDRSNHIDIKYHYIKDMLERGELNLQYMETYKQITNVLTKLLARVKFEYFLEIIVVTQIEVPRKRE